MLSGALGSQRSRSHTKGSFFDSAAYVYNIRHIDTQLGQFAGSLSCMKIKKIAFDKTWTPFEKINMIYSKTNKYSIKSCMTYEELNLKINAI